MEIDHVVLLEEFELREAFDAETTAKLVFHCAINFADVDIALDTWMASQPFPSRLQSLTMTTPRRVELTAKFGESCKWRSNSLGESNLP